VTAVTATTQRRITVLTTGMAPTYTINADHDALTSLRRGLAEYLYGAGPVEISGRPVDIKACAWDYSDVDTPAVYPSLFVGVEGEAMYDGGLSTGGSLPLQEDNRLLCVSEITATLLVDIWCADRPQRHAVSRWIEEVGFPNIGASSLRLALGFYYGAPATYSLQGVTYGDADGEAEEEARRGYRRLMVRFDGNVAVYRRVKLPGAMQQLDITVLPTTEEL
jgi:hypothetical protein